MDKVKAWLAQGAQPSDRVSRSSMPPAWQTRARNNPEKAWPRKERKGQRPKPLPSRLKA